MITLPWDNPQNRAIAAEFCAALDNEGKRFHATIEADFLVIRFAY